MEKLLRELCGKAAGAVRKCCGSYAEKLRENCGTAEEKLRKRCGTADLAPLWGPHNGFLLLPTKIVQQMIRRVLELQDMAQGLRGVVLAPLGRAVRETPRGGTFCYVLIFSSTPQRNRGGGQAKK